MPYELERVRDRQVDKRADRSIANANKSVLSLVPRL